MIRSHVYRCCAVLAGVMLSLGTVLAGQAVAVSGKSALAWQNSRQMVLVLTDTWDSDHGILRRYTRQGDGWQDAGTAQAVTIGRAGAAWGLGLHPAQGDGGPVKHEGDGRSPAGVFAIGEAFGYAQHADTGLAYTPMHATSYCVDVSGSPLYNRIVDARVVGTDAVKDATEHMRLDLANHGDQRYRLGFVIEHNQSQQPTAGSCIFAHLWKHPGAPTAGCTAMAPATMQSLQTWLRSEQHPVFVLLPRQAYERLHESWQLPAVAAKP